MKRRLRAWLLASVAFGALAAWALWPDDTGPAGPSISERARQAAPAAGALSARVISSDDLPPEGTRSLFDHLVAQNEGLPYPFEKIVALIQAQDPEGRAPLSLLIPDGRSLLKAQAHFERPRVLVAADFQAPNAGATLGLQARGRLFLGFVEDAAEIEVISYNEAAGRYEFQLVQDYRAGGVPRIVYARRAICTTCHQGAAPIFPQRPWSETNAHPAIAQRISEARGESLYMGQPAAVPLAVPERFDELTDVANFVPVAQRVWLDGCGEGAEGAACRRQMLGVALAFALDPGGFDAAGPAAQALRAAQAARWPAGGIAVAESDLRNRDPLTAQGGLRAWLRRLLQPGRAAQGPEAGADLEAFERLPRLPALLDPVTPRPPKRMLVAADLDGAFGLAQFLTAADVALVEDAAAADRARLRDAVGRLAPALFEPAPFRRVDVVNALLQALGEAPRAYPWLDTSALSPPQTAGVPPLDIAAGSPLRHFERYCFACHRGNPAKRLDFMAGASEAEVLERIRGMDQIRDALDWSRYRGTAKEGILMPPADSWQRRELEAALARGEPVLDDMREAVPALFDF